MSGESSSRGVRQGTVLAPPEDSTAELRRLIVDTVPAVEMRRGPAKIDSKYVIIGTSGSMDCLRDADPDQYRPTRQDQRFWPVAVPRGTSAPDDGQDDGQSCDGLHDEDALAHYLSRCFPDLRGDLAEPQDDDEREARRDDDQEME